MSTPKHTNALVHETSPYLLQHAHNPVQWHPWGEEALRRAREEDKPILLSIGYSACHWCHVMERESFENEAIAAIMNEHFINIKVDREERPDLDAIYMSAVQMMTGHGGWPMTVFLTPDQVPFYGGTYFPPEDRHGMPGFPRLLRSVAQAYEERKSAIQKDASSILETLRRAGDLASARNPLESDILDTAVSNILAGYDARHGGFGGAPKFPPSMSLSFLLRSFARTGKDHLLQAVETTLEKMAHGGIYDQLGGGFHRYSVDQHWLVPHFEKMLYDNALLSRIYLDAFLLTRKDLYRRIACETLDYVTREMTSPDGGFYSTQDADSEGHEGRFFVWTRDEVDALLGDGGAELFCSYFDVTPEGNFEGRNILHVPRPADIVARMGNVPEEELLNVVARGKRVLFEAREKRVRPGRDEKILTAWNGLMLRSFAEAAAALDREDYRRTAARNAEFVLAHLRRGTRLLRSFKDGEARLNAYLEDYACLIDGLLSLYEATFEPRWVREASRLAEVLLDQFHDGDEGGFYFTSQDHESLIHRPRDYYDNATPSGSSVAVGALLRLARLTGEERWSEPARAVLESMVVPMSRHPSAFSHLLCGLDFLLGSAREIAVVGDPADAAVREMLRTVFQRYLPNKVVACGTGEEPPLLRGRPAIDGKPTVYVCRNFVCREPLTAPEDVAAELEGRSQDTGSASRNP